MEVDPEVTLYKSQFGLLEDGGRQVGAGHLGTHLEAGLNLTTLPPSNSQSHEQAQRDSPLQSDVS